MPSRGFLGDRRMPPLLPRRGSYLIRPFDPFRGCKLGVPRVRFLSPIKASCLLEWDLGITASDCLEWLCAECPSTRLSFRTCSSSVNITLALVITLMCVLSVVPAAMSSHHLPFHWVPGGCPLPRRPLAQFRRLLFGHTRRAASVGLHPDARQPFDRSESALLVGVSSLRGSVKDPSSQR